MKAHIEHTFTYREAQEFQRELLNVSNIFNTLGVTKHSAAYKLVGIHLAELALELAQKMVMETTAVKQRVNNKTALAIRAAVDAGLVSSNPSVFTCANELLAAISESPALKKKKKLNKKQANKKALRNLWKT